MKLAAERVAPADPQPASDRPGRYLLLTGAKVNAGDFLIRQRCLGLLATLKPRAEIREHDRWEPLDSTVANWADAVVLCGGPALQPAVYPDIVPLTPSLDEIRAPIIALGLGWKGIPGDACTERTYRFTAGGRRLVQRLVRDDWAISCRDAATERVLGACGVSRTVMTGDPAWFDPENLGRPFEAPTDLGVCLVSMPASSSFFRQSLELLRALRRRGTARRLIAAFNHGWTPGRHLDPGRASAYRKLRDAAKEGGAQPVDLSGDVARMIELAVECHMHVGYRLHTHLLFLSRRKPTLLLEEDGRGSAAGEALGLPGVRAWVRPRLARALLPALGAADRWGAPIQRSLQSRASADEHAVARTLAALDQHQDQAFSAFAEVTTRMDCVYRERMRPFVESLP